MQSTTDRSKPRIRAEDSRYLNNRSPFFQNVRMLARYSARMPASLINLPIAVISDLRAAASCAGG